MTSRTGWLPLTLAFLLATVLMISGCGDDNSSRTTSSSSKTTASKPKPRKTSHKALYNDCKIDTYTISQGHNIARFCVDAPSLNQMEQACAPYRVIGIQTDNGEYSIGATYVICDVPPPQDVPLPAEVKPLRPVKPGRSSSAQPTATTKTTTARSSSSGH